MEIKQLIETLYKEHILKKLENLLFIQILLSLKITLVILWNYVRIKEEIINQWNI